MNKLLRVWWIPQVPGKSFYVCVSTVEVGIKMIEALAQYDIFQYENNIKPDYSNAGGLQMFDPDDKTDNSQGSWVDWYYEDNNEYFDDPEEYIEWLTTK